MDYVLFADEADQDQGDLEKFFVFGGAFVPAPAISRISKEIEELRNEFGLDTADQLKFHTRSRPGKLSREDHTELKRRVFAIAAANKVSFSGYTILHAIAKNQPPNTLIEWGANILLAKFNQYLNENQANGWAQFDRINTGDPYSYLRRKFSARVPVDGQDVYLDKICGYSFTCDGASHLSSVTDILVGGFRYIINEPTRDKVGRTLLAQMSPLFWSATAKDGKRIIRDRGFVLRPRSSRKYDKDYQELRDRLKKWSREARLAENDALFSTS